MASFAAAIWDRPDIAFAKTKTSRTTAASLQQWLGKLRAAEDSYSATLAKLAASFPTGAAGNEGETTCAALEQCKRVITAQATDHASLGTRAKQFERVCASLAVLLDDPSKKLASDIERASKAFAKSAKQREAASKKLSTLQSNFDRKKQFKRKWIQGGVPTHRIIELKGQKADVEAAELGEYKARQERDGVTVAALRRYQHLEFERIGGIRAVLVSVAEHWHAAAAKRVEAANSCKTKINAMSAVADSRQFLKKVRGEEPCPWPGVAEEDERESAKMADKPAEPLPSPGGKKEKKSAAAANRAPAVPSKAVLASGDAPATALLTTVLGDTMADPTEASREMEVNEEAKRRAAEDEDGRSAAPRASIHATDSMLRGVASLTSGSARGDSMSGLGSPKSADAKAIAHDTIRARVADKRHATLKRKKRATLKKGEAAAALAAAGRAGGRDPKRVVVVPSASGEARGRALSRVRSPRAVLRYGVPTKAAAAFTHTVGVDKGRLEGNKGGGAGGDVSVHLMPAVERTIEHLPWFPGDHHARVWNPSLRLWKLASLESLLLGTDMFGGSLSDKAQRVLEDVIRVQMEVSKADYLSLVKFFHFPSLSCPKEMYMTVNYRLHALKTLPMSDFDDAGEDAYVAWFDRQAAVILASLLWHVLNDPQDAWRVAGKQMNSDKLSQRLEKLFFALRAKVREECGIKGDGVTFTRASRFRARTVMTNKAKANSSVAYAGKSSKELLDVLSRLMAEVVAGSTGPKAKGVPGGMLAYPSQVVHNMYGHMVWTAYYKMEEDEDDIAERKARQLAKRAKGAKNGAEEDDDEEPEVAHLHHAWRDILAEIGVFRKAFSIRESFHSLCMVRIITDVISSQAAAFDCNGLDTCIVDDDAELLDLFDEGMSILEKTGSSGANQTFWHATLRSVMERLDKWLEDYHQSDPTVVQRFAQFYVRLLDLKAGRARDGGGRKSSSARTIKALEFESIYIQEKKISRLMNKSVEVEYNRIRAQFPRYMDAEDWLAYAKELVLMCDTDARVYAKAWHGTHRAPQEVSLTRLADCLCSELTLLMNEHQALDNLTLKVLPIVARVVERFQKHAALFADGDVLLQALPVMDDVYVSQLNQWIMKHADKTTAWLTRSVSIDDWRAIGANTPYSSSVVDTFSILFSLTELFFRNLAAIQPVDGTSCIPHFTAQLSAVVSHYADIVMQSCDEPGLEGVCPTFANRIDLVRRWNRGGTGSRKASSAAEARASKALSDSAAGAKAAAGLRVPFEAQSVASFCVRYCDITMAQEQLTKLSDTFFTEWKKFAAKVPKGVAEAVAEENGWDANGKDVFANLKVTLERHRLTLCSLIAGRVVYVEWAKPLVVSLYSPKPSSASVEASALHAAIDETMADLYTRVIDSAFNGVVMQVFSYLMDTLEWVLLMRDYPLASGGSNAPSHELLMKECSRRLSADEQGVVRADLDLLLEMFGVELEQSVSAALSKKVLALVE